MAVNIVAGRSKSGKSKYIYDKIKQLCGCKKEIILIVPEQYTHAAERKLLDAVGAIKDNSAEVFSFMRLAAVTEKRLAIPNFEKIDSVGKALIVEDILKNGEFKYFKSVCSQSGFTDLCVKTISEFKKYMITPEDLDGISSKTDDEVLKMKLDDLSEVYRRYESAISLKYSDSDDVLTILSKHLESSGIYKDKYIFLDEFSTFVPQELRVIQALEKQSAEMFISLCYDKGEKNTVLFAPTSDTINSIKKSVCGDVKLINLGGTHFNSRDISFLEKNLYAFPAEKFGGICSDVKVISCSNPRGEAEIAAVGISSLVRDRGYRYSDIGVICSDVSVYDRHMERIFKEYGIPYFIDVKNDVLNHHIVRFVLGLLDVYINDYSYESIFNYLKAAFLDADAEHISVLENYILRTNIHKNSWLDDDKWNRILNNYYGENEAEKKNLNSIREKYILPLAQMHEKIKGRRSVEHNVRAVYDLIVKLDLPGAVERYKEKFKKDGEVRLLKEYEQIWDLLIKSFDEVVYICGDKTVNVSQFRDLLYTAFSQHQIGYIPSVIDRVIVGNTERTRVDGLKALFVLGVNEGVFPIAPKRDGVLSDRDKQKMQNEGVEFSTTSEIAAYYSEFSVYKAFTMPSEKLIISYSKAGNDFKTLRRSYIAARILKLMNISEKSENDIISDVKYGIISPSVCKTRLAEAVADYGRSGSADPIWKNVYNYFDQNSNFTKKLDVFSKAVNLPQKLNIEKLKRLTGDFETTSVSRIQRYAACHFSYFMDYILNVNEQKTAAVDSLDIGNITHSILERLCRQVESDGIGFKNADDAYIADKINEMLEDCVDEFARFNDEFSKRNMYIIKRLKGSIFICFKAIQRHIVESMFEPLGYEMEFKDGSDLGCITVKLENEEEVKLTGKIDRADVYRAKEGTFVRVVDYKTGSKSFKLDDIFYGLDIQLVVYLNALVKSDSSYNYGGALYFMIDDPVIKSSGRLSDDSISEKLEAALKLKGMVVKDDAVLSGYDEKTAAVRSKVSLDNFRLMDTYIEKILKNICTSMAEGDISINPYKKGSRCPCDYCKYLSVCRFDITDKNNSYNYLETLDKADDVWQRMEAELNVDKKSADGN